MHRIFIDGKVGTTGLAIYERIKSRADCELLSLSEQDRKSPKHRRDMLHACDVAFLCLPDEAARESVSLADGSNAIIIDASTAHRTSSSFTYGFPELGYDISASSRIAVPGCHASGFLALIVPLIRSGIISREADLSCFSITGYSGGGKAMIAQYEDENRPKGYDAPRHYSLLQSHKHLREMTHVSGLIKAPVFNPVIGDFYAGMLVSVPLHVSQLEKDINMNALRDMYKQYYAKSRMIAVMDEIGDTLSANALANKDNMEIFVTGNDERVSLMARYDNLGKGASGAAVQCMNIALSLDEASGLRQ